MLIWYFWGNCTTFKGNKKKRKCCATSFSSASCKKERKNLRNFLYTQYNFHSANAACTCSPPRVDLGQGNFRHWVFIFSPTTTTTTTTTLFCNHSISNSCWKRHETCVLKVVCRLTVWQSLFDWMSFLRFCDLQTWIISQFHKFYIFLLVPQWKCIFVYVKYIYICQLLLDIYIYLGRCLRAVIYSSTWVHMLYKSICTYVSRLVYCAW